MSVIEMIRYAAKQVVESVEYIVISCLLPIFTEREPNRRMHVNSRLQKILIIQMNSIGDVVMSSSTIKAIRNSFPDARIDVLALPVTSELMDADPYVDNVHICGRLFWRELFIHLSGFKRSMREMRSLRSLKFDVCVDLCGVFDTVVYAKLSGARVTVGPAERIKRGFFIFKTQGFYDKAVDITEEHIVRRYAEIAAAIGIKNTDEKEEVYITDEQQEQAARFLHDSGLCCERFAVIHPGAKWPPKRWPAGYYAELVKILKDKIGMRSVLIGSPEDESMLNTIRENSGISDSVLATSLTIGRICAVIKEATVFVGNDSGPAHIASAMNIPSVVLFGPTRPEACAPLAAGTVIMQEKISCWPCRIYFRRDECESGINLCMQKITPDRVIRNIMNMI